VRTPRDVVPEYIVEVYDGVPPDIFVVQVMVMQSSP
jgi:phosphoribosylanthranilate isomerase